MGDALMWIVVTLFFFIPVAMIFVLVPIGMYNIAWRAFGRGAAALPVYVPVSRGFQYFRPTGWTTLAYGAVCLCHGLTAHLLILSFVVGFCPDCTASPFQRAMIWIWISTWVPLISARWWMARDARAILQPDDGERLLFWDRIGRSLVNRVRSDRRKATRGARHARER